MVITAGKLDILGRLRGILAKASNAVKPSHRTIPELSKEPWLVWVLVLLRGG